MPRHRSAGGRDRYRLFPCNGTRDRCQSRRISGNRQYRGTPRKAAARSSIQCRRAAIFCRSPHSASRNRFRYRMENRPLSVCLFLTKVLLCNRTDCRFFSSALGSTAVNKAKIRVTWRRKATGPDPRKAGLPSVTSVRVARGSAAFFFGQTVFSAGGAARAETRSVDVG